MKRTTGTWHRFSQRILLLATLLIPFAPAGAFVDPPTFSPMQPHAGQPVDMSVRVGVCHTFAAPPAGIPLLEVQTNGNTVDAIITGVEVYDPLACIFGIGTITLNIGELPEGSYTVRIRIRRIYPPFQILSPVSEAPLQVLGPPPPPVMVPTTHWAVLIGLVGFIGLLAVWRWKQHIRMR